MMWAGTKKAVLVALLALFVGQLCLAEEGKDAKFIGNKNSKVFHKADCAAVKKMKEENKVVFASVEEAMKAKFRPCKKCIDVKKKKKDEKGANK